MKELEPAAPAAIVQSQFGSIRSLFEKNVVPSYGRFDVAFERGEGSWLWDVYGHKYLDLGGGIAVCSLGHANPEISQVLVDQSRRLVHVSNLYYNELQGRLAQAIVRLIGPGKVFFCNSGAEANEGLFKVARKFGHQAGNGDRFEIITALNSFHGRTLAGISATGQQKVKDGFAPLMPGFRHVPYNDLEAMKEAIRSETAAILIEGIQGEGGITAASPQYLLGLRKLCDEKNLLLLMDGVQCGHFRTGRFQSFQRILEDCDGHGFLPDGIAMAKSLGGGFPIGAFWVREPYADLLGPGSHGTTYGGTPLGCAVALKIIEVVQRDRLDENARVVGERIKGKLEDLAKRFPRILRGVRGLGLMIGIEFAPKEEIPAFTSSDKPVSIQMTNMLHGYGLVAIPSGAQVIRLLPALNLRIEEADYGVGLIEDAVEALDSK